MRTDLDTLLPNAAHEPGAPLDPDELWGRGRRRRAARHASAAGGGLVGVAALALVATSLVGGGIGTAVPEIAPMTPPPVTDPEQDARADTSLDTEDAAIEEDDAPVTLSDGAAAAEQQRLSRAGDRREAAEGAPTGDDSSSGDATAGSAGSAGSLDSGSSSSAPAPTGPTPNWAQTADPCASHDRDDIRAFIDVASPVDGQQITKSGIALVGCSSVYEGTIRYRISQGDTVVEDGFITASAGGPELGEFRAWIELTTTGTHTLEVFWDSPADGEGERDRTRLDFEIS